MLFALGGLILTAYGLTNLIQKGKVKHSHFRIKKVNYLHSVAKGFLMNVINVGVFVFWLGVVVLARSQFKLDGGNTCLFFTLVLSTYFAIDLIKIFLAKQVKKKLTLRRIVRIKQIIGLILTVFGAVFTVKAFLHSSGF